MLKNKKTMVLALVCLIVISPLRVVNAESYDGVALGGLSYYLDGYYKNNNSEDSILSLLSDDLQIPDNIVVAKVNDFVNIREKPSIKDNIVGILTKNSVAFLQEEPVDGWAHIKSGKITGYISTEYLYIGDEAITKAKQAATLTAEVLVNKLNVRETPNTESSDNILAEVSLGEFLHVIDASSKDLITKNDPKADVWVRVTIDNMDGYVTREYVDLAYTWKYADKPTALTNSSLRNLIVREAQKYLGLRYVWGGESLASGADCSGYVRAVYKKCGINISKFNRTASGMATQSLGRSVTLANAQPGDLVFYANSRGVVDHVAMYIGNGQVIHESGYKEGCKISKVNYRTVYRVKNFLD